MKYMKEIDIARTNEYWLKRLGLYFYPGESERTDVDDVKILTAYLISLCENTGDERSARIRKELN